jgi:cytochrome c oxidase subunit III
MPPVVDAEELKLGGGNGGGPPHLGPDDHGGGGGDDGGEDSNSRGYVPGAGLLAMRFLLVSVTTLFATVGVAYHARARLPSHWQHIQAPHWLWLSTALILASSWTIEMARGAFDRRNSRRYAHWLGLTLAIGLAFLTSQLLGLRELAAQGIFLRNNPHSSLFYVITGSHGLHLLGGMIALSYLLIKALVRPEVVLLDFRRQRARASVSALYWHFLSGIWLVLFLALLFWP